MKDFLKKNKFNIIYFLIISTISFITIFFHEAWRDEAQQWLLVKNMSLIELISFSKYEGHFLLWYLIIMLFAKLGFPYITQNIISWFFNILALFLFMKFLPSSDKIKKTVFFILPITYLFSVVSRCYCLIPLAMVLITIFYKERFKKPVRYILAILLLANTHIIMLSMVGFLLLEFFFESIKRKNEREKEENKRIVISFVIAFIGLLISFLPLFAGLVSTNKQIGINQPILVKILLMFFTEPFSIIERLFNPLKTNIIITSLMIISIYYLIYYEIRYYKTEALKIALIVLWHLFIYGFIFGCSEQRACTVIFIIMFFVLNREENKNIKPLDRKIRNISLAIFVIVEILCTFKYIYNDYHYNYSSAKQTAEFISENIEKDSIILVGNQEEFASPIIPYLGYSEFYHIPTDKIILYSDTNDIVKEKQLTKEKVENAIEKFSNKNLYYIYMPIKVREDFDSEIIQEFKREEKFEKIFESDLPFENTYEQYVIYKIIK